LVVSWGYDPDPGFGTSSKFQDYHQWQGTRDLSAFLTVPAAIDFMHRNDWDHVREVCHGLALFAREEIQKLTGLPSLCPADKGWLGQMVAARLPDVDTKMLKNHLFDQHRIEVPVMCWNDQPLIRISIQAYNTREEVEKLVNALADFLSG
jgi:isopenicillin-N epimerase